MRLATAAVLLSSCLPACARPAQTAADALRAGDLESALELSPDDSSAESTAIARTVLAQAHPRLEVQLLDDDAVASLVGAHVARCVLTKYWLVRTSLHVEGHVLTKGWTSLVVDAPSARVPSIDTPLSPPYELADLTGEHFPTLEETSSEWRSDIPYPPDLLKPDAPPALVFWEAPVAAVEFLIGGWIFLHHDVHYRERSDEELAATAPNAMRLEAMLQPHRDGDAFVQTFLVRRPLDPTLPLTARVAVTLSSTFRKVATRTSVPLRSEPSSVDLTTASEVSRTQLAPSDQVCPQPMETSCPTVKLPTHPYVSTVGLGVPPPPDDLGTAVSSDAARPSWARSTGYDGLEPGARFEGSAVAAPDEPVRQLICSFSRLGTSEDVLAEVRLGARPVRVPVQRGSPARLTLPLLRIAPGGSLSVAFVTQGDHPTPLATVSIARRGAGLVTQATPGRARVTMDCKGYDRRAVEQELSRRIGPAVDAVDDLDEHAIRLDPRASDLGLQEAETDAQSSLGSVAALVGWDDPRVRHLVERLTRFEARFGAAAKAVKQAAAAPAAPTP